MSSAPVALLLLGTHDPNEDEIASCALVELTPERAAALLSLRTPVNRLVADEFQHATVQVSLSADPRLTSMVRFFADGMDGRHHLVIDEEEDPLLIHLEGADNDRHEYLGEIARETADRLAVEVTASMADAYVYADADGLSISAWFEDATRGVATANIPWARLVAVAGMASPG